MMASVTDTWPTTTTSTSLPSSAVPLTPSKRASRSSRISNDTDHPSFLRTSLDPDSGLEHTTTFRVGDVVVVGKEARLKQKFLATPPYVVDEEATKGKGRGGKKGKGSKGKDREEYEGWTHEDGLKAGEKVAVITRLFEDVRGRKNALVRWFARPGAVWGPEEPDEEEEAGQVLPYELYYTSDSTFLAESRLMRQRAAANPFSSPSASPSKSAARARPSLIPSASSSTLSAAASFRTPQHSDPIPLSSILSLAEIFSPSSLSTPTITAAQQLSLPMFLCRRVYDVKPIPGAGFWKEVEWDELRRGAVEVYREKMEGGETAEATDGWDVEAAVEVSEGEEEERRRKERRERKGKGKGKGKGKKAVKVEKPKERERERDEEEDESSDDGADEEDTFDPRSKRSVASSSDEDDGDDSSASSSASGSDSDDDDFARPSKGGRASSSRHSSVAVSPSKRPRAPAPKKSTAISVGRAAKRRRFASAKSSSSGVANSAHNPLPPLLSSLHLSTLTPFERAKALLHVSATPESLPCREEQRETIRQFLGDAILGRSGGCLYVHGVPGTGKTATVHSVVRELQNDPDMDAFTFVEINGMKISEPMAAFPQLWSALAPPSTASSSSSSARKPSPRAALSLLESHFANPDPARKTTVVLVDELDQMLTKRQDVLYSFFNWPHVPHSRLVVVAVANTMDLPERELSGKIRSRLGTNRIPFQPYTWTELKRILEARLALVDPPSSPSSSSPSQSTTTKKLPLFDDTALQKIAKSVAGISGDARKALDVARRTLDRVALRLAKEGKDVTAEGGGVGVRCTIQDATQAYNDMTRQGPAMFVRGASTMSKVLLLAVAQCVRRAGVQEVEVDTVFNWHLDFLRQTSLLSSSSTSSTSSGPPSRAELLTLLTNLHSLRLVATESQRLDVFQRVRPAVDEGDLFAALREDEVLKLHVPKVI